MRWRLCERCGHLLAGACYGKTRWSDLLAPVRRGCVPAGCGVYACCVCTRWHVGRVTPETADLQQERVDMIRKIRAAGDGWLIGMLADEWDGLGRMERIGWKIGRTA